MYKGASKSLLQSRLQQSAMLYCSMQDGSVKYDWESTMMTLKQNDVNINDANNAEDGFISMMLLILDVKLNGSAN